MAIVPAGASAQDSLSRLPEAPAKQLVASKCASACHNGTNVFDQARTPSDWTDVVVRMRDYGAKVSFEEQKEIVGYLAKNLGRAPAPPKPAKAPVMANAQAGSQSSADSAPAASSGQSASPAKPGSGQSAGQSAQAAGKPPAAAAKPAQTGEASGAATAEGTGGLPPGPGKELVLSKCTMCHNLDRVIGVKRTRGEWQDLVTTMQEFGADVYGDDEKAIVDYLAKSFPADK